MSVEFTDEYGVHSHETIAGPPYDFKKPMTCKACIAHFIANRDKWRKKFSEKHNLPDNFWEPYQEIGV